MEKSRLGEEGVEGFQDVSMAMDIELERERLLDHWESLRNPHYTAYLATRSLRKIVSEGVKATNGQSDTSD